MYIRIRGIVYAVKMFMPKSYVFQYDIVLHVFGWNVYVTKCYELVYIANVTRIKTHPYINPMIGLFYSKYHCYLKHTQISYKRCSFGDYSIDIYSIVCACAFRLVHLEQDN